MNYKTQNLKYCFQLFSTASLGNETGYIDLIFIARANIVA